MSLDLAIGTGGNGDGPNIGSEECCQGGVYELIPDLEGARSSGVARNCCTWIRRLRSVANRVS